MSGQRVNGQQVIGVWRAPNAAGSAFDVAVASLPERTEAVGQPSGAIAVVGGGVGGGHWWPAARQALSEGAIGLVLTDVVEARIDQLAELAELASANSIPVVIDRALLRADLVEQAVTARMGASVSLVNVEVSASTATMPEAVREAVGWVRELCGPVRTVTVSWAPRSGVALLETVDAAIPVALTLSVMRSEGRRSVRDPAGASEAVLRDVVLSVSVLGETRTAVLLDPAAGRVRVATTTADGEQVAPARREARQRLTLRRILDALAGGSLPGDIDGVIHDFAIAERLVRAREHIDGADFTNRQSHLP